MIKVRDGRNTQLNRFIKDIISEKDYYDNFSICSSMKLF